MYWSAFSSTSTNRTIAEKFADKAGVIFRIDIVKGKDISALSAIPGESEILLPPNAAFFVVKEAHLVEDGYTEVCLMEKKGAFRW